MLHNMAQHVNRTYVVLNLKHSHTPSNEELIDGNDGGSSDKSDDIDSALEEGVTLIAAPLHCK